MKHGLIEMSRVVYFQCSMLLAIVNHFKLINNRYVELSGVIDFQLGFENGAKILFTTGFDQFSAQFDLIEHFIRIHFIYLGSLFGSTFERMCIVIDWKCYWKLVRVNSRFQMYLYSNWIMKCKSLKTQTKTPLQTHLHQVYFFRFIHINALGWIATRIVRRDRVVVSLKCLFVKFFCIFDHKTFSCSLFVRNYAVSVEVLFSSTLAQHLKRRQLIQPKRRMQLFIYVFNVLLLSAQLFASYYSVPTLCVDFSCLHKIVSSSKCTQHFNKMVDRWNSNASFREEKHGFGSLDKIQTIFKCSHKSFGIFYMKIFSWETEFFFNDFFSTTKKKWSIQTFTSMGERKKYATRKMLIIKNIQKLREERSANTRIPFNESSATERTTPNQFGSFLWSFCVLSLFTLSLLVVIVEWFSYADRS